MARLAWFAPSPSSGVGCFGHDLDLVARLEARHTVDWFCGDAPSDSCRFSSAHDFVWKHEDRAYDLTIYEVADLPSYSFVWPYLVRYPGLVVLHDARLHHSRGGALLTQVRVDDYRVEFGYNHPAASPDVPRLAHAELLGVTGELWPMRRAVTESSRLLLAPNPWVADDLRRESSHDRIGVLEPGVPPPTCSEPVDPHAVSRRVRQRYGIGSQDVVFLAVGDSPYPRQSLPMLSAFAQVDDRERKIWLLLGGTWESTVLPVGAATNAQVVPVGPLASPDLDDHLVASDVFVSMQWPDRSDGVRTWLLALAAGKPTVVADLGHRVDLPSLDPRDWKPRRTASPVGVVPAVLDPACVTVDMVDEEHSLKLACRRLAEDARLRTTLGQNAHRLWASRFSNTHAVGNIDDAVTHALAIPLDVVRRPGFPAHLLDDGTGCTTSTLAALGLDPDAAGLSAPERDSAGGRGAS